MAAAIIPLIPGIISAAPSLITAIGSIIGNLVHKHEKTTVPATPAEIAAGKPPVVPATGPEKKAAVMNDFAIIAGPLIALILHAQTGRDVDIAATEAAVSKLIDDFVALHKALGIAP